MEILVKSGISAVFQPAGARLGVLDHWQVALGYGAVGAELTSARERVALADVSAVGKLMIQGQGIAEIILEKFGVVPQRPTELVTFEGGWITRLNRYEYYAVLPLAAVDETVEALRSAFVGRHAQVTTLTHGRDAFALIGPRAPDTLGKVCGLNFHEHKFPNEKAQISSVAKVTAMVARLDRAGTLCYEVHLDRSFSEYVWAVTLDAAEEFAGQPIGREALQRLRAKPGD